MRGLLGLGFPFFSPSLLPLFPPPFSFLLSAVTSSFWVVVTWGGGKTVVVVAVTGGGCANKKLVSSARLGPSHNNELLLRGTMGVNIMLTIDAHPLGQDVGLKRLHASSNTEKQTKFTNCEFKFEI